jgi:hypothetical protein
VLRIFLSLLFLVSMSGLIAACGGGGDDDDDGDNPFFSGDDDSGDDDSGDDGSSGGDSDDDDSDDDGEDSGSGGGDVDLDDIADGAYANGTLHLEISGDADQELDLEDGGGFATGGFASLAFTDGDATTVNLAIATTGDDLGGMAIATDKVITAGEWGTTCDLTVKADDDRISGEFSCESLDGLGPEGNDVFDDVNIRGEFSLSRE